MDPADHTKILLEIQAQVSTVSSQVSSFKEYYEQGRAAQLVKATGDEKHFQDIKDEIAWKVDKREVKPLLSLNWLMINWKLALFVLFLMSSLGLISITSEILKKLLHDFGGATP